MKTIILIFCMGVLFFSCSNDDELSNRDLLNGNHWILKEVENGPFGYYDNLFAVSDFSLDKTGQFISYNKTSIRDAGWILCIVALLCLARIMPWLPVKFNRHQKGTVESISVFAIILSIRNSMSITCTFCKKTIKPLQSLKTKSTYQSICLAWI